MTGEHLRTDYDRMVGESYKEYAARMRGQALAAGKDRDAYASELLQLRRWLRACSLGRATKETHAEIRAYLDQEAS